VKRLRPALGCLGRTETTFVLDDPEPFHAMTVQEEEATATTAAERSRPGLTLFTDGSRLDSGAAGTPSYGRIASTGAASKRAWAANRMPSTKSASPLAEATRGLATPDTVTYFTDAQAAMKRLTSEDPGPGQMHAFQARSPITTLRRARPDSIIEMMMMMISLLAMIRWCQSHQGDWGNEKVDEWAKLAAEDQMHRAWNGFIEEPYLCCYPGPWHSWSGRARRRSEVRCFIFIYHPRVKGI
jgi:ribonuclease HI